MSDRPWKENPYQQARARPSIVNIVFSKSVGKEQGTRKGKVEYLSVLGLRYEGLLCS